MEGRDVTMLAFRRKILARAVSLYENHSPYFAVMAYTPLNAATSSNCFTDLGDATNMQLSHHEVHRTCGTLYEAK